MAKATEEMILDVARKQFVQNGYSATRMQEIADEAGINKALLHYYFRSKDKLYKETISATLNMMIPRFASALSFQGPFWDKIDKLLDTYINLLIEHPDIPFFIMSELSQKQESFLEELKKRSNYFPIILGFISEINEEMESGHIRKVNPLHLFLNIMSMCIFPFIAKPIFCTVNQISEENFKIMMKERKAVISDFLKHALKP